MQSPINMHYLVKKLQIKINQLNSRIKELEDSKTSLKTTKKSIASISTITKNQLARVKS